MESYDEIRKANNNYAVSDKKKWKMRKTSQKLLAEIFQPNQNNTRTILEEAKNETEKITLQKKSQWKKISKKMC